MSDTYHQLRERIYHPLRQEGIFTWDELYDQEYALASIHLISREYRREIAFATEKLGAVFTRTAQVIQQGSDDLLATLDIPPAAFQAVRVQIQPNLATLIGRFDFAPTPAGLKLLEFNADTPSGVVEAFYVNEAVCRAYQVENPNAGMERQLTAAFQESVAAYRRQGFLTENIVFSALDWHVEDAGTSRYLLRQSGLNAQFVPLKDLKICQNQLQAILGDHFLPVHILHRLHPLEILAAEQDTDGYPTGPHCLDLIAQGRTAIINPPIALISQSKALQAILWNLYETNEFLTPAERELVGTYMLPTYLENRFAGHTPYAAKPVWGREGNSVTLYDNTGCPIAADPQIDYQAQPKVYQQLADLETATVITSGGRYKGHLLWGSFLVGGQASAIVARIGSKITGNMAYYLPVGLCPSS